jgi:hypothetical protein
VSRIAVIIALSCCLLGCGHQSGLNAALADYSERLTRVLALNEVPAVMVPIQPLHYPERRPLRLDLPDFQMDLLDFLKLLTCDLNTLVAERNTGLGKVLTDSQLWRYEVKFVRLARTCADQIRTTQPELAGRLLSIANAKQTLQPRVAWNALWAGPEFQAFLGLRSPAVSEAFLEAEGEDTARSLSQLVRWRQDAIQDVADFEVGLERVNRDLIAFPRLGEVIYQMELAVTFFQQLNSQLDQHVVRAPVCRERKPNEKSRILMNVLTQIYVGRVQPHLADLQRLYRAWAPPLWALYQVSITGLEDNALNPALARWVAVYLAPTPKGIEARFQAELREHAAVWNRMLAQCGMAAGTP